MSALDAWLSGREILICDGAMGTMLQASGLPPGACPELWNFDRPDAVEAVTRAYVDAGADLVETNSFGGNPTRLAPYGLADRCAELCRAAARIARKAADGRARVLGSMGPTGHLLEPLGQLTAEEAQAGFRVQAEALAEGGANALCVETMTDLAEALCAVRAAVPTGLPVLACMTFERTRRGCYTIMGVEAGRAARTLEEAGAAAVGCNCGSGPEDMVEIVRALRGATELPIMAQPNAGLPDAEGLYPATPVEMAARVIDLLSAGARILGGCCGTTPDHVRAMARAGRLAPDVHTGET